MSNKLTVTRSELEAAKDIPALFEIENFKKSFVSNYALTRGVPEHEGMIVWERERTLFMQQLMDNKKLMECSKVSLYSAWISLAASGQTLGDGCSYIVPYKQKAEFQIGWKGRINQMYEIPEIKFVNQPEFVLEGDAFEYELAPVAKIIKHKPQRDRKILEGGSNITEVYMIISTTDGDKTFIMTSQECTDIRDKWSQSYKYWLKKKQEGTLKEWEDEPMWVSSPGQAFRKTLVKRVWQYLPKTKRQLSVDALISNAPDPELVETDASDQPIDLGFADDGETYDIDTGEAVEVSEDDIAGL